MSNQLAQSEGIFEAVSFESNGENITLSEMDVVNFLVSGGGNIEKKDVLMFMNLCKYQKLNPFLKEAYLVKFGNNPAQIITSKEAFMKRAESHPQYEGFEAGIIVERDGGMVEIEGAVKLEKDIIIGGWCKVYRKDRKYPVVSKISFSEFNKAQSTWKSMPLTMIRKSAVVNGLREAFPENLGAMYTEDDADIRKDITPIVKIQQEIEQNANQEPIDIAPVEQKKEPVIHVQNAQIIEKYEQQELITNDEGPGF
ncbi:MAG: phage recombination protein Bet [Solibacillus sp.]